MVKTLITLFTCVSVASSLFSFKFKAPMTTEELAELVGLSVEEFTLLSSVVEAESNRSTDGDLEGRIYIAVTIINRVNSDIFPNTVTEVLTQSGQFSTVRGGHSVTNRTEYSDEAVVLAYSWVESCAAPNCLFFNCRGYFSGREPVAYVGGNYFSE